MYCSLLDILNDEFAEFTKESAIWKCFRLYNLYGLVSSFVSIFLNSQFPIAMSFDIISMVGSLASLYLSRLLRLKESAEGKRAARLRFAAFEVAFHTTCFFLALYAYLETKQVIILLVWLYHIVMIAVGILMVLFGATEIMLCKFCNCLNSCYFVDQAVAPEEISLKWKSSWRRRYLTSLLCMYIPYCLIR